MKTLEQIRKTPVLLLTMDEIAKLDPKDQQWAINCQARHARELACKHEWVGISTQHGYHSRRCRHCGKDDSYDSGD